MQRHPPKQSLFYRFARKASEALGSPLASILALLVVILWASTGPVFGFSDTWQLVINTGTTVMTFLMVFLIQNSQNRDAKAVQIKLDELIRSIDSARNQIIDIEDAPEQKLQNLQQDFSKIGDSFGK